MLTCVRHWSRSSGWEKKMLTQLQARKRKGDKDVVSNKDDFLVSNRNLLKLEMISWKGTRYLNSETWQEVWLGYERDWHQEQESFELRWFYLSTEDWMISISFSGHSNAILLSLPSMPFSILECIRPEHGHSRLRLYCAETDRFSNSDFYVKKGKNIPCKTRARDPSNPNNLWQRAWELWLNSHLAGVAGKSLKKGSKPCKNWVQGKGENVQHRKLSGTYIILMYSRMW